MLIPRRDLDFQLYEVLDVAGLCRRPWFGQHDREVLDGTLDAAYRLAEERFLPYAALTDQQEPRLVDGTVHMVPETRAALDALGQGGFIAAAFDEAWGGLQLPYTLVQACSAVFAGAHVGFHAYAMLTAGAANLVLCFGTEEQKRRYARPMLEGRYFGTMCLSETGAGSSLADIRTRATPRADGRYLVSGDKMWISGGEHELAENIVHMVLARLPDAPAGVRGISLFVVPRFEVGPDGSLGGDNDVRLAGLNHKMGWRGTVNTVLSFGDEGRCTGELLGAPHRGLASMFQMMNEARIGVGICAVALGFAGYRYSLGYAQERRQGRPLADKDPASPPVPIIAHADVRRMLLAQKAWVEGGLGLVLYCARLVDDIATGDDPDQCDRDRMLLELLTPIAKSWPSEFCLEANKLAIQVLGGYGYTRDLPGDGFDAGRVRPSDMWGCSNAQIFSEVSPEMHWEFAIKHDLRWLKRWGLTYYGCCEPLDKKLDLLRRIPNLRKFSVSYWNDLDRIVSGVAGDYVLSYKPTPAIFAEDVFNPSKAREDLERLVRKADGACHLEIIMKDISTVCYEPQRLWEWTQIAAEEAAAVA